MRLVEETGYGTLPQASAFLPARSEHDKIRSFVAPYGLTFEVARCPTPNLISVANVEDYPAWEHQGSIKLVASL